MENKSYNFRLIVNSGEVSDWVANAGPEDFKAELPEIQQLCAALGCMAVLEDAAGFQVGSVSERGVTVMG